MGSLVIGRNVDRNNQHGKIIEINGTGRAKKFKVKFNDGIEQWMSNQSFWTRTENGKSLIANDEDVSDDSQSIVSEPVASEDQESEADNNIQVQNKSNKRKRSRY